MVNAAKCTISLRKKWLTSVVVLALSLSTATGLLSNSSWAGETYPLNPVTLRQQLLHSNLSLISTLNQVAIAKEQVNQARASLLPSLNLGAILNPTGPTFILSTVQFLLPFLLPSNWFNLSSQERIYRAEKISYRILELNTYSSALALYYTVLSDVQLRKIYEKEAVDLGKIRDINAMKVQLGVGSKIDLAHSDAQLKSAQAQVSRIAEINTQELSALRRALGLSLADTIVFESSSLPASAWESSTVQEAVDQANSVAPEKSQIDELLSSSRDQRWSQIFSPITSASLGTQSLGGASSGQSVSLSSLSSLPARASVNLGFGIFPAIRLSRRNQEQIELQKTALIQLNTQILESALGSIHEAQKQLDLETAAEVEMQSVYEAENQKYNLGLGSLVNVLLARTQEIEASVSKVKANLDLNLQRVTLHRALVDDQFALIEECAADEDTGPRGFFRGVFGGRRERITMDQLCRPELAPASDQASDSLR